LQALDETTVTFGYKDYRDGDRRKSMTLALAEFVRRFCLHLLPKRFVKIRHFGFLSNRQRKLQVGQARVQLSPLSSPAAPASTQPNPEPSKVCPHCGSRWLLLVEIVE